MAEGELRSEEPTVEEKGSRKPFPSLSLSLSLFHAAACLLVGREERREEEGGAHQKECGSKKPQQKTREDSLFPPSSFPLQSTKADCFSSSFLVSSFLALPWDQGSSFSCLHPIALYTQQKREILYHCSTTIVCRYFDAAT